MVLEQLNIRMQKINVMKYKTLEENFKENLYVLGFGKKFLDMTLKVQDIKEKFATLEFTKLETFAL